MPGACKCPSWPSLENDANSVQRVSGGRAGAAADRASNHVEQRPLDLTCHGERGRASLRLVSSDGRRTPRDARVARRMEGGTRRRGECGPGCGERGTVGGGECSAVGFFVRGEKESDRRFSSEMQPTGAKGAGEHRRRRRGSEMGAGGGERSRGGRGASKGEKQGRKERREFHWKKNRKKARVRTKTKR